MILFGVVLMVCAGMGGGIWWSRNRLVQEYRVESLHQTVRVVRKGHVRSLRFDSRGQQGAMDLRDPEKILFPYQHGFLLYQCLMPEVRSFLAIGVGTGTALQSVRRLRPDCEIYGVDIDHEVIRVAQSHFQCPDDEEAYYYAMDGRRFLQEAASEGQFDLVFLDAYADDRIPARLETVEFVRLLKSRMSEQGVVCVNLIASVRGVESRYLRQIWRTYRDSFQHVVIVPTTPIAWESQNVLLFATDNPLPTREEILQRIAKMPWPDNKRRLFRQAGRLFLPQWEFDQEKPLTDAQVRLFEHRSTRS